MPKRLASKIIMIDHEHTKSKLCNYLENGEDDIPTFLGGTADHEMFYPKEGAFPDKQLTFDYEGMIERLKVSNEKFQAKKKTESGSEK